MNKNNSLKVLITSVVLIILIVPLISSVLEEGAGFGSTGEVETDLEFEVIDGISDLKDETGEFEVTEKCDIETSKGTIPNVESGNLVVENGNPVSGKLSFSADSSFDLDDKHITVPKGGSIEFKDGKIIVSKDTSIEVDDTEIQAMIDETEIKIEKDLIEVKGKISVDYKNSPDKIILIGEGSSIEVQTDEDEKFEFKNSDSDIDKNLIVNIGSFHKSEDCTGNCISYQEMGIGMSGEEWNKLKVDGNALITKYYEEEKIYTFNFEDGKAKISRDLSKLAKTTTIFNQRTIINYEKGDITLFVETSVEKTEGKDGRINAERGITDVEYYDLEDIQASVITKEVLDESIQEQISQETTSDIPNPLKKKAEETMINSKSGELYTTTDGTLINKDDKSIAETVRDILNALDWDTMTDADIFAAIQQETSFNPRPGDAGSSIGLVQASVGCFKDVLGLWKKLGGGDEDNKYQQLYDKYKKYLGDDPTGSKQSALKTALDDATLNLEVSISYFKLMEDNYGFSEKNLGEKYGYTGDEKDIQLLGYNGGPPLMKRILDSADFGEYQNFYDLEKFFLDENQRATKEAKAIFKTFKVYENLKDIDIDMKVWYMINHVRQIKTYAGYSGYEPYEKPDWVK